MKRHLQLDNQDGDLVLEVSGRPLAGPCPSRWRLLGPPGSCKSPCRQVSSSCRLWTKSCIGPRGVSEAVAISSWSSRRTWWRPFLAPPQREGWAQGEVHLTSSISLFTAGNRLLLDPGRRLLLLRQAAALHQEVSQRQLAGSFKGGIICLAALFIRERFVSLAEGDSKTLISKATPCPQPCTGGLRRHSGGPPRCPPVVL